MVAGDYSYFVRTWNTPGDGLRGFLLRFLASKDEIDQHIAVWTLTQLLESNGFLSPLFCDGEKANYIDRQIQKLIRQTPQFPDLLRTILRNATAPDEAVEDNSEFEDESGDESFEEGNEVVNLSRSALISLKKLPTLEELEKLSFVEGGGGQTSKTVVEEPVPSGEWE